MYKLQDIENQIINILSPNNDKIKEGSIFFKSFIEDPASLTFLKEFLNHNNSSYKQISLILFEKSISKNLVKLQPNDCIIVRDMLIELYFKENVITLRKRIIAIIEIFIIGLKDDNQKKNILDDLIIFGFKLLNENEYLPIFKENINVNFNNINFSVINNATSNYNIINNFNNIKIGIEWINGFIKSGILVKNLKNIMSIYFTLSNDDRLINSIIIGLSFIIIDSVNNDIFDNLSILNEYFTKLVISKLKLIKEDNFYYYFESILFLVESDLNNNDIYRNFINSVVMHVIVDSNMSFGVIQSGLDMILEISNIKKSIFLKDINYLKSIIEVILKIGLENKENDTGNMYMINEVGVVIKELSFIFPRKKLYPLIKLYIVELQKLNSLNGWLLIMEIYTSTVENYGEFYRNKIEHLLKEIFFPNLLKDNIQLKSFTLKAIAGFIHYMTNEVVDYYKEILPILVQNLTSTTDFDMIEDILLALEILIEKLTDIEIYPYLDNLINLFVGILKLENANHIIIKGSLNCIGTLISISKQNINKYSKDLFSLLKNILYNNNANTLTLKGDVISNLGKLAHSQFINNVELLNQSFSEINNIVINFMINQTEYSILEGCFTYWYNLVEIYKNNFNKIFSLEALNIVFIMANKEKIDNLTNGNKGNDIDNFSLNSERTEDERQFNHPEFIGAKTSALKLLGLIIINDPFNYSNILNELIKTVELSTCHLNEEVRNMGLVLSKQIAYNVLLKHNNGNKLRIETVNNFDHKKLEEFRYNPPVLNDEINLFIKNNFIEIWIANILNDNCKINFERYLDLMEEAVEEMGLCIFNLSPTVVSEVLLQFFQFSLMIQNNDREYEKQDEDDEETDNNIFKSACNLIAAIVRSIRLENKNNYSTLITTFLSSFNDDLFDYVEKGSVEEFENLIGLLCEIFEIDNSIVGLFKKNIFEFLHIINDTTEPTLLRNICYLLGILFDSNYELCKDQLEFSLIFLFKIKNSIKEKPIIDNLIAACIKIFLKNNSAIKIDDLFNFMVIHLKEKDTEDENDLNAYDIFKGDCEEMYNIINFYFFLVSNNYQNIVNDDSQIKFMIKVFIDTLINFDKCKLSSYPQTVNNIKNIINSGQKTINLYNEIMNQNYSNKKDLIQAILEKLN